jgi:two-component system phosphate regulon sensor histidine kinase PhoR
MRIHTRLAWITLAVCLVALGSATLLWNASLRRERRNELNDRLVDHARILTGLLPAPGPAAAGRIDELVRLVHQETQSRITVIARDGTVLAESNLSPRDVAGIETHRDRPEVQEALERGIGYASRRSNTLGRTMAYAAVRWGPSGNPYGVVRASLPMTRVLQEQNRGRERLLLVVAASLALAGILGYVAARRVTHPLARISQGARSIGAGRLDQRLEIEGAREARDLALAVNQLADSLQAEIREVDGERSRLAQLLEGMPDGIVAVDRGGRISLMNEAARDIFDLEGDPVGATPVEAVRNTAIQSAVDQALAGGRPASLEVRLVRPEPRHLAVSLVPLASGLVLVVHDQSRLRRLEEARREIVANIGHELRTPLSAILGYLETLESGNLPEEDVRRFLEIIHRNSRRLERLVRDLSHLSRLESPEERPRFEPVSVPDLVHRTIESLAPKADGKRVTVRAEVEPGLPAARGDRHGLETVLLNLLDNAVRVTESGGTVVVSVAKDDGSLRVAVQDAGPGIAPEFRERVFERFFRIDPGRSAEEGGSGLGLAIVKHTVLLCGGEIWIEDAPGRGAVFVFKVPSWDPPAA